MKLLILGGTRFLGRALVHTAVADSHQVTLFNRGQSNPDLYPEIEQIHGDRDGGLRVLNGRSWDAVIDTCGYVPRLAGDSARFLADAVGHYTFISTISVYANPSQHNIDEQSPLGTLEDETVEEIDGGSYGPLKVLCENVVTEAMNGRALHVRSGLIVGPHDPTDRFTYWPQRVARGGTVLAPGAPDAPVQFIDVRDLAAWILKATEAQLRGAYNITGPAFKLSMQAVLETAKATSQSDAQFEWVSDEFLLANDVGAYTEIPLWVPTDFAGFGTVNINKGLAAGLCFRPLADTIRDTFAWSHTRPADYKWRGGLTPAREMELLTSWKKQQ